LRLLHLRLHKCRRVDRSLEHLRDHLRLR